jgi:hypothetical protein
VSSLDAIVIKGLKKLSEFEIFFNGQKRASVLEKRASECQLHRFWSKELYHLAVPTAVPISFINKCRKRKNLLHTTF